MFLLTDTLKCVKNSSTEDYVFRKADGSSYGDIKSSSPCSLKKAVERLGKDSDGHQARIRLLPCCHKSRIYGGLGP